jgi:energy-converting hydrogenase Eha subunit C
MATRIISIVTAVPAVSMLVSFNIVFLVSCGYLDVRIVVAMVARSAPLVAIPVGSVIFG